MRILFSAVGLSGHLRSLVPLAWACRIAGHEVLLCTSPDSVEAAVVSGLPVLGVGADAPAAGVVGARELADAPSSWERGRLFGRSARERLDGTRRTVRAWRPDLVVVERADLAGRVVAAENDLPWMELRWSVEAPREYEVAAHRELRTAADDDSLRSRPREIVTPWPDALRRDHRSVREYRHVPYEGPGDLTGRFVPPSDGRRVCITLGTVVSRSGRAPDVPDLVRALAQRGCEVVIAAPTDAVAQWGSLPAAVRVAGHVPVSHLLESSDVVVHHGGHGTALAAVLAGRPSVMTPSFDDQHGNAAALARAGAGVVLGGDTDDAISIADHCLHVLEDPAMLGAATDLAALARSRPGLDSVVERVLAPLRTCAGEHVPRRASA
ncbi:glycosyltransferase [Actinomycetospora atypica]|uniref:Glycosyltransferase n=1 Tax=Actinomycetospora atypica TaxID=1290095 RepID=A0ABV9YQ31_9PSEU